MLAPYFYTSANTARVNLAIEIPPNTVKFDKQKGKLHATVNVMGIAYTLDGAVAARFSDSIALTFEDKKDAGAIQLEAISLRKPVRYCRWSLQPEGGLQSPGRRQLRKTGDAAGD